MPTPSQINLIKNAKIHCLLLKKQKNTGSAQLCNDWAGYISCSTTWSVLQQKVSCELWSDASLVSGETLSTPCQTGAVQDDENKMKRCRKLNTRIYAYANLIGGFSYVHMSQDRRTCFRVLKKFHSGVFKQFY